LQESKNIADKYSHQQIDVEHLLLALIEQSGGIVVPILQKIGVDIDQLKTDLIQHLSSLPQVQVGGGIGQIYLTPRLDKTLENAWKEAQSMKDEYLSTEHMLISIADEDSLSSAKIIKKTGVTKDRIFDAMTGIRGGQRVD
jgi:ATP-dependent Clp protease ATP-binding subunit ClpB